MLRVCNNDRERCREGSTSACREGRARLVLKGIYHVRSGGGSGVTMRSVIFSTGALEESIHASRSNRT